MVRARCVYLSAGCEARSHCVASSRLSNRVVFASHSELVVADADIDASCLETCSERWHRKPITCVKRVHSPSVKHVELFVSGSADGRVNVWRLEESCLLHVKLLDGIATSISSVCGWLTEDGRLYVAASSMGVIRLWKIVYIEGSVSSVDEEVVENEANHFFLSLDLQRLTTESNGDAFILCAGTSKRWIDIYTGVIYPDSKMEKSLTLKDAHDDWVHALEFDENEYEPILASSGQDSIVKLWRFERRKKEDVNEEKDVVKRLEVKRIKVEIRDQRESTTVSSFLVHIHAVLSGHEDWVHAVHWHPERDPSGGRSLVTASSDKAVVMWTRMENGVWADTIRLGIIGGQATGFYGVVVCGDGETIVGSSYYGGLHAWQRMEEDVWVARPLGGGHCGRVSDVVWSRGGTYLLSTSSDNTTRMHSRYGKINKERLGWIDSSVPSLPSVSPSNSYFVEIGRPQVHGHEIECISTLGGGIFVSGSEEKILRVFEMPRTVAESLSSITGEESIEIEGLGPLEDRPWGASVPALGLSNTAIERGEGGKKEEEGEERHWEEEAFVSVPQPLTAPPTEEFLQQNTLWPETHKLYGHGFELFAIAAHPDSGTIVSASRASQATHAALLQWTPPEYTEAPKIIAGHALTVTQCEFSPDGKWLLSVSRDRTVIVYGRSQDGTWTALYQSASKGGPHSRIIWSCAWFNDSLHFVTVSREGKVILWEWNGETATVLNVYSVKQSVTAVGVGNMNGDRLSDNVVVIGFESGAVDVLRIDENGSVVLVRDRSLIGVTQGEESAEDHTVTRIRFCPRSETDSSLFVGVSTANKKLHVFELSGDTESVI